MCKTVEGVNGRAGRFLDWSTYFLRWAIVALLSVHAAGWWAHEQRLDAIDTDIAVINNTRFSASDGLEVWREIASIQADLNNKADEMGAIPVLAEIEEIKRELERMR